ncbi:hypothetical protein AAFC00_003429 [Neodothiora populina]|uniref:poly(A)-specific ribonuclease n=1 Tax=Neodothiora populina TaxID=2781224 RepID=A0ABR3PEE0_9PEZI
MPPAVGRMHASHMSNPFAHLNPSQTIPQSHYQQQQSQSIPQALARPSAYTASNLNGGISPFAQNAGSMASLQSAYSGSGLGGAGSGLASEAAFRGFAHGAALQQQQQHQQEAAQLASKPGLGGRIRDVWAPNFESEMVLLRELITKYPYVSMDAEFPGIVARPIGNFENKASYHYQTLRCNVDLLKPIQLGITIWTPEGELPPQQPDPSFMQRSPYLNNLMLVPCTWSFNFRFSLDEDMYAEGSIELLKKAGLDFRKHQESGIDLNTFGAALTSSGLTFMEDVNWLSFHSGYDFGYLIKLLTDAPLPAEENDFRELVKIYFPKLWDIKFLLRHAQRSLAPQNRLSPTGAAIITALGQKSGLQDLAEELGCQRHGAAHTGGSDAWLTGSIFWAMKNKIFDGHAPEELADQIYGLHGVGPPASAAFRDEFLMSSGGGQPTHPGQHTPQTNGSTLAFHTGHTPTTHRGEPSTPTTSHANAAGGMSGTPGPTHFSQHHAAAAAAAAASGLGSGGVFGNFQYAK